MRQLLIQVSQEGNSRLVIARDDERELASVTFDLIPGGVRVEVWANADDAHPVESLMIQRQAAVSRVEVRPREILKGDRFVRESDGYTHWQAIGDAVAADGIVSVPVAYGDGGRGQRTWDDLDIEVPVTRTFMR